MRRPLGLIALALGASLIVTGNTYLLGADSSVLVSKTEKAATSEESKAEESGEKTPAVTVRTHETIEVTPEEQQRAALAKQKAVAEERGIQSRMRSLQALMQKEEEALAKRLAYAAKIREQGLSKNDQKLLDQAEQYERRALEYYQKRVQQFEQANVSAESTTAPREAAQPRRSSRSSSSSRYTTPTRSTSRSRTRR